MHAIPKPPLPDRILKNRIQSIMLQNGYSDQAADVVVNAFLEMREKLLFGGCHALSSALYVALSELGLTPELCIGVCLTPETYYFTHSWLLVDGKVLDLSIYMPFFGAIGEVSGPVICGQNILSMGETQLTYGIGDLRDIDHIGEEVLENTFLDYMDGFPAEYGLWGILQNWLPENAPHLSVEELRDKYEDVERIKK